jgi:hypothetical protein
MQALVKGLTGQRETLTGKRTPAGPSAAQRLAKSVGVDLKRPLNPPLVLRSSATPKTGPAGAFQEQLEKQKAEQESFLKERMNPSQRGAMAAQAAGDAGAEAELLKERLKPSQQGAAAFEAQSEETARAEKAAPMYAEQMARKRQLEAEYPGQSAEDLQRRLDEESQAEHVSPVYAAYRRALRSLAKPRTAPSIRSGIKGSAPTLK